MHAFRATVALTSSAMQLVASSRTAVWSVGFPAIAVDKNIELRGMAGFHALRSPFSPTPSVVRARARLLGVSCACVCSVSLRRRATNMCERQTCVGDRHMEEQ